MVPGKRACWSATPKGIVGAMRIPSRSSIRSQRARGMRKSVPSASWEPWFSVLPTGMMAMSFCSKYSFACTHEICSRNIELPPFWKDAGTVCTAPSLVICQTMYKFLLVYHMARKIAMTI